MKGTDVVLHVVFVGGVPGGRGRVPTLREADVDRSDADLQSYRSLSGPVTRVGEYRRMNPHVVPVKGGNCLPSTPSPPSPSAHVRVSTVSTDLRRNQEDQGLRPSVDHRSKDYRSIPK